jgi:hypothetical protein
MPWWGWVVIVAVALLGAVAMSRGRGSKKVEKEVRERIKQEQKQQKEEAKRAKLAEAARKAEPKKKAEEQPAVAPGLPVPSAALATPLNPEERDDKPLRLRQGDLPVPPGQHEFRLVKALEGDKLKASVMIAKLLQQTPYWSREQAAAAALADLHKVAPLTPSSAPTPPGPSAAAG